MLHGRSLGAFGIAGCFSFFATKILPAGEGGALVTDSDEVAEWARLLRSHGMTATTMDRDLGRAMTYDVTARGFNYRIDELRSALLCSRLAGLEANLERRRELVRRYRRLLASEQGLLLPWEDDDVARSSCYMMPVLVDPARRAAVRRKLREVHGVQTAVYPAAHELRLYRDRAGSLPRTERVARSMLALPLFAHLSREEQDRVVAALGEALR
jgi:dTDP-4-amino-4,6-dideoxygalactose transaminase